MSRTKSGFLEEIWEKTRIWGLGCLGGNFIVNCIERVAQKVRRIILLHFGLWFHVGKTRKPFMFMVFGFGGRDDDSHNQLYLILRTPGYFKRCKKKQINSGKYAWEVSRFRKFKKLEMLGGGVRTILKIRLLNSWRSWIWDRRICISPSKTG